MYSYYTYKLPCAPLSRSMESSMSNGSNWWPPMVDRSPSSVSIHSDERSRDPEIRNGWMAVSLEKARFQQRQLVEKEQKMVAVYEAQQARALGRVRASAAPRVAPTTRTAEHIIAQGKVRQMFEERRTKAGIDKSYPLQPISCNTRTSAPTRTKTIERADVNFNTTTHIVMKTEVMKTEVMKSEVENTAYSGGDLSCNVAVSDDRALLRSIGKEDLLHDFTSELNNNIEDETFPESLCNSPSIPISSPKRLSASPNARKPRKAINQGSPNGVRTAQDTQPRPSVRVTKEAKPLSQPKVTDSTKRERIVENNTRKPKSKVASTPPASPTKQTSSVTRNTSPMNGTVKSPVSNKSSPSKSTPRAKMSAKHPTKVSSVASATVETVACSYCQRNFANDRLQKHETICKKSAVKKRKPYDALKHRVTGTDAEPFLRHLRKVTVSPTKEKPLNCTWRQKHEDFIRSIRAAKEAQAYIAAGGKLTDLPPPPPSENPDYIQCPHCKRRFNQAAAERHIPKCATHQFNKPRQTSTSKQRKR